MANSFWNYKGHAVDSCTFHFWQYSAQGDTDNTVENGYICLFIYENKQQTEIAYRKQFIDLICDFWILLLRKILQSTSTIH